MENIFALLDGLPYFHPIKYKVPAHDPITPPVHSSSSTKQVEKQFIWLAGDFPREGNMAEILPAERGHARCRTLLQFLAARVAFADNTA